MSFRKILLAVVLVSSVVSLAPAQNVDDAIELGRTAIQAERKVIVAASMGLTPIESADFWPLYREYRLAIAEVDDQLLGLIEDFAVKYNSMTDEQAKSMVDQFLALELKSIKVRKKHLKNFRKILPEKKVLRFVQVENKLDAIVRYELAKTVLVLQ